MMTNNSEHKIAKYILLVGMLMSFVVSVSFLGFDIKLIATLGAAELGYHVEGHNVFSDTQIQIKENSIVVFMFFLVIVPASLFAAWYCYFSKHYRIGILFVFIPIFYIGFVLFLSFPTSDFGKVLRFWFDTSDFSSGLMAAIEYWVVPIFVLASVVRFFSVRDKQSEQ